MKVFSVFSAMNQDTPLKHHAPDLNRSGTRHGGQEYCSCEPRQANEIVTGEDADPVFLARELLREPLPGLSRRSWNWTRSLRGRSLSATLCGDAPSRSNGACPSRQPTSLDPPTTSDRRKGVRPRQPPLDDLKEKG